jgi:hypothetical protein
MRVQLISDVVSYLFLFSTVTANLSAGQRRGATCIRQPEGVDASKTPGDNGYRLKISGNPDKYFPGEVYTGTEKKKRTLI